MKTIRVFVSASDDLGDARLAVQDLLAQLNRFFKPHGIEFVTMLPNEGPADGDLAVALYWKDFGSLPQSGFERAYEAFKEKKSPKIYVFFKEPDPGITEALGKFKDSFATTYGQFYCHFEAVDSVKFQLAVKSLELLPEGVNSLKVEDSAIVLGEERITSLDNLPFAKLNAKRQSLLRQIDSAQREVADLEAQYGEAPDNETLAETLRSARVRRHSLQEELKQHDSFLFDSAVFFAKESAERMDDRVRKAYELFEQGKVVAANKILDLEELIKKDCIDKKLYDEARKAREKALDGFILAAETALSNDSLSAEEKSAKVREDIEKQLSDVRIEKSHTIMSVGTAGQPDAGLNIGVGIVAPATVSRGDSVMVQAVVDLIDDLPAAIEKAKSLDAANNAVERGTLAVRDVRQGAEMTFQLDIRGLEIEEEDRIQSHQWDGKPFSLQFFASVPNEARNGTHPAKLLVFVDGRPVGRIGFVINVTDTHSGATATATTEPHGYTEYFVSYSDKDLDRVLPRVQGLRIAEHDFHFFFDKCTLRAGQRYEKEIFEYIDNKADVFLLFWSANSAASEWVEKEWRHALSRQQFHGGIPDIIPVPLDKESPPPPQELSHLHFTDSLLQFSRGGRGELQM